MKMFNRLDRSWAILPATMCLFGKRKVTIVEAAKEWKSGTVLVCTNEQGRVCFIYSSGRDESVKVGDANLCHHDQTLVSKGIYRVQNVIFYREENGAFFFESKLPFDIDTKASLAVFK